MTNAPSVLVNPPPRIPIPITVPQHMYAIVIIEFQGRLAKTAKFYVPPTDNIDPDSVPAIEKFNSCLSGVTRSFVIDGSHDTPSPIYDLNLECFDYQCCDAISPTRMNIVPYSTIGGVDSDTGVTAVTYLYTVDSSTPDATTTDSFGITIVLQNMPGMR